MLLQEKFHFAREKRMTTTTMTTTTPTTSVQQKSNSSSLTFIQRGVVGVTSTPAPTTPWAHYPLTFADVFENVLVRNVHNSDNKIGLFMKVKPRSDFILCTDADVNAQFQSATSLHFDLFDSTVTKSRFKTDNCNM